MTIMNFSIVDSIEPNQGIDLKTIKEVFNNEVSPLIHGDTFTGRPVTKIIANDNYVIKCHSEYQFNERDSKRWIEQVLAKERQYYVHNPSKTWFYVHQFEQILIANITPKLLPLHIGYKTIPPYDLLKHMENMADIYFYVAANFNIKLDEGLSNYGIDQYGKLYYIDDDIYKWDNFNSLTQILGVWFRQLEWLSQEHAQKLGVIFRKKLLDNFNDTHWIVVISQQINKLFYANEKQVERKQHFLEGFEASPSTTSKVQQRREGIQEKKFAILADIHANFPALTAVLSQLDKWGLKDAIVLGDIVGYGPHPMECIHELQKRNFLVIKGNHDHALIAGVPSRGFSPVGRWVLEWTADEVGSTECDWLAALPAYHQQDDWIAVHGAPQDKTFFNAYIYQLTYEENLNYLAEHAIRICLHGHTHIQGAYYHRKKRHGFEKAKQLLLEDINHCLVCPGSVGQPRSGKTGAEFAIFDQQQKTIHFYQVDYDLEHTIRDMHRYGFPIQLIDRLRKGR
ncbi:MAG: metallophosphoesterase family protein [Gammaproteobacteria bacterium]|nr:metallophosphoesterase family protein [Gammaproteobacteria bacterium]